MTNTIDIEEERKRFEDYARSLDMDLTIVPSEFSVEDIYSDCNTDYAWMGWKACAARCSSMGAEPDNVPYMIVFDDADKKPEMLIGRDAAGRRYRDLSVSWNAHLFAKVNSNSRDCKYPDAVLFAPPSANMGAEPVAYVERSKHNKNAGGLQWTNYGLAADLPDGTKLYASAPPSADAKDAGMPTMDELLSLLPEHYYMDPPDGGSVSVFEQLKRMAKDANRYRHLRECNSGSLVIVKIIGLGDDDQVVLTEEDADAEIDAAISASKETK